MQLKKKEETSYTDRESKPVVYDVPKVDWKLYEENPDADIPQGKYTGHTLRWVMVNDTNYYGWMVSNSIIASWGLIRLKPSKEKPKEIRHYKDELIASDGTVWLFLVERPDDGTPSPYL